jgi:hypothetical protein
MKMANDKRIVLHEVRGGGEALMLLDGVDQNGKVWVYHRQRGNHTCTVCGALVMDGWVCFDNGDAVCTEHVTIVGKMQ